MYSIYVIISVIIVSLISVIAALPLLLKKEIPKTVLIFLLSFSVGVLLSAVFMDLLPESFAHSEEHSIEHVNHVDEADADHIEHANHDGEADVDHIEDHSHSALPIAFMILAGFLVMFILEKLVHWHHNKGCERDSHGHGHAYNLAPINLIGDGVHNFIDGLVIAGAYAVNIALGITTTISIIFHEIPQELADFGVLLYSGWSKKKALIFNFISASTAILGAVLGLFLIDRIHGFTSFIVPFAAGNFIYIAASNLLPQLHRHCKLKDTLLHLIAILLGVGLITLVVLFAPAHSHG